MHSYFCLVMDYKELGTLHAGPTAGVQIKFGAVRVAAARLGTEPDSGPVVSAGADIAFAI